MFFMWIEKHKRNVGSAPPFDEILVKGKRLT